MGRLWPLRVDMRGVDDSPDYYRMLEAQEREAADRAPMESVRKIHLALAAKYQELAAKAERFNDN